LDSDGFIRWYSNDPQNNNYGFWRLYENINGNNIYQIECKKISGAIDYNYGMVFGASNNVSNQWYALLITADGWYRIRRNYNGNYTTIKDWMLSDKLFTGYKKINCLKVIRSGAEFTVFLNNFQVYALPHQKCYPKKQMPHLENVTQIKCRL